MKNIFITFVLIFLFVAVANAQVTKRARSTKINTISKVANTNITSYDFTAAGAAYTTGPDPMIEVETNKWALIAGDANSSGTVSNSDKDPINNNINASGYYEGDINISGIITNSDKDLINSNINKSTQIP